MQTPVREWSDVKEVGVRAKNLRDAGTMAEDTVVRFEEGSEVK